MQALPTGTRTPTKARTVASAMRRAIAETATSTVAATATRGNAATSTTSASATRGNAATATTSASATRGNAATSTTAASATAAETATATVGTPATMTASAATRATHQNHIADRLAVDGKTHTGITTTLVGRTRTLRCCRKKTCKQHCQNHCKYFSFRDHYAPRFLSKNPITITPTLKHIRIPVAAVLFGPEPPRQKNRRQAESLPANLTDFNKRPDIIPVTH